MPKILNIIDTAYRATLEEQDDTAIWLLRACKNSGANLDIVLTGNAVNYGIKNQNPGTLEFGKGAIPHPSKFQEDLGDFVKKGGQVFYIKEDADYRGISPKNLINAIKGINRIKLAGLMKGYDLIWHW